MRASRNRRLTLLTATLLLLCLACGCGRPPAWSTEYAAPFQLSELLDTWDARPEHSPGVEIRIEILDALEERIPYALVELEWEEGGRISFQADHEGLFWMRFPELVLEGDATVWVRVVPYGQELAIEDYASFTRPFEGGTVRVQLFDFTPTEDDHA